MAKVFSVTFGTGDPRTLTGLSPTFLLFFDQNGATLSPPAVSEAFASSGIYKFTYTPTLSIMFLLDGGAAAGSVLRYASGVLDPIQTVDQIVGTNADSYGSTSADPSSVFGMAKRIQENLEGNSTFNKSTGVWNISTRGSTTLLISKTIADSTSTTTKT